LATGFSIGEKVYVGTGLDFSAYNDFWEYDPSLNTWTQKANFGGSARVDAIGFSIGNKGFIGTGYDGSNTEKKDFWEYDPAANTWMRRADFRGSARYKAVGFSIGNKGYVGTGTDRYRNNVRDFWEYDPSTGDWTQKANFGGTARYDAVGFSIGNKGFIGTGYDFTGMGYDLIQKNDFWEYNPASDTWAQKADVAGIGRSGAVGFSIADKGFIGTGYVNGGYSKDFWEYDPALNKWTRKEDLNGNARTEGIGIGTGTKGYIGTGVDISSTRKAEFWEYDPANESTYLWSNGATTPSITATSEGSYTVRVTNSAGCSAVSDPLKVTVRPVPSFTAQVIDASCMGANDGIITINATGGNGTYSYSKDGSTYSLNNTFTGLSAATYRIITGSNDCASLPQDIVVGVNPGNIAPPTITAGGPTRFLRGWQCIVNSQYQ
jgi:hypothetical protein